MKAPVVCIDGPAASGKTTIARALAASLGFLYLDTGVLYRALTWEGLRLAISPADGARLAALAQQIDIMVEAAPPSDPRQTIVKVDVRDVSLHIRSAEVDAAVSEVSAHPEVRAALVDLQRDVAARGGTILAGRDTGTVIWPQAEVKLFLVASEEERAGRRQLQAAEQGNSVEFEVVLAELRRRDSYDSSRSVAPLKPAADAVVMDTTHLSVSQVVAESLALIEKRTGWRTSDRSES